MASVGGQPGNKNATKAKPWADAIRKFAKQNPNKRDKVIEKLYGMAEDGDLAAIKEIIDRTEGKTMQPVEVGGNPENPFQLIIKEISGFTLEPTDD